MMALLLLFPSWVAADGSRWHFQMRGRMFVRSRFARVLAVAGCYSALCGGCSDDARGSGRAPSGQSHDERPDASGATCNPLANTEQAISLGMVIAAGRAPDGKLYVVDRERADGDERLFVSEADTLVRRRVLGAGSTTTLDRSEHTWTFDDAGRTLRLFAQRSGSDVTMMAVGEDRGERFIADAGVLTQLTVLDESSVRGLPVRNLPGEVVIEYLARVEDGRLLLITRPRDDWQYEDFRLFWGREPELAEWEVQRVTRARDGGTTHIEFTVDGKQYTALFPSRLSNPASTPTLRAGDQLWRMALEETVPSLSFVCL